MIPAQIISGARTVAHLATYFEELKQTALGLRERFGVRQRGYFTPSEDEEARHLLVSYWQARSALFEMVISFRDDRAVPHELEAARFLIAYAAAILLVDAARFLRETYDVSPAIHAKLNEAETHFGIPPGSYDAVQQSLTSPLHAWHLYHAMKYFDQHQKELRELADNKLLAPVLAVIDRLGDRLRISITQYTAARLRVRGQDIASTFRRGPIAQAIYGLQKIACRMVSDRYTRLGHHPALPADVADEIRSLVEPGDVFITRKEFALTNYFLPGYWPHAALYLGDADSLERLGIHQHQEVRPRWLRLLSVDEREPRRVLEALKDGVWIRSLASPFSSDAVAIVRPRLASSDIAEALVRGLFHEGKPYDFDFDFTRSDRLVCTEVVYRSYEGIGDVRFTLTRRAGRLTLAAEDLLHMALDRVHFEPVAVFAPSHATRLLCGSSADEILHATMGETTQHE